jgi:hypothetical protein
MKNCPETPAPTTRSATEALTGAGSLLRSSRQTSTVTTSTKLRIMSRTHPPRRQPSLRLTDVVTHRSSRASVVYPPPVSPSSHFASTESPTYRSYLSHHNRPTSSPAAAGIRQPPPPYARDRSPFPVFLMWAKRPNGPCSTVGRAQVHSAIS